MKRRKFLKLSAATAWGSLGVGGALGGGRRAAAGPGASGIRSPVPGRIPGCRMRLSLAAYSFRQQLSGNDPSMTLEDFVDYCARHELDGTEPTSYYFRQTDVAYLASLRRRAHVNGLAVSGTPVGNNFCLPPGPKRDEQIAHVKSWIERASLLGAHTIRVFAGNTPKGHTDDEARAWAIEGFRECCRHAARHGVLLALENHGGITARVDDLLALVDGVDSPWFGVNLDTGNFHHDVYPSLRKAAPRAVAVQVKVEIREEGKPTEEADFQRIVDILKSSGYRGFVALEYEAREDPMVAVPRYLEKLREALNKA